MGTVAFDCICGKVGVYMLKLKKGSMTVEAALILPLVLMLIFLLVSLMIKSFAQAWEVTVAAEQAILLDEAKIRPVPWIRMIQAAQAWKGVINGS